MKTKIVCRWKCFIAFNLKRAEQLDNSQLVYDYALSIGPAAKLDKTVKWNKRECVAAFGLSSAAAFSYCPALLSEPY
jgi:hypothetical protein